MSRPPSRFLPGDIKEIMKQARADANYPILTKQVKLQHEKKLVSNLKSIESVGFEQTFTKFIEVFVLQKYSFCGKKIVVETILVVITDSSNVCCFDLYLINMFMKSTKSERYMDIMFKVTLYCLPVTVEDLNLQ